MRPGPEPMLTDQDGERTLARSDPGWRRRPYLHCPFWAMSIVLSKSGQAQASAARTAASRSSEPRTLG